MTYKLKYIGLGSAMALMLIAAFSFVLVAKANPSFFIRSQLASATTTVTYMTPGAATTTLQFDMGVGSNQSADEGSLNIQFAGSSTAATLNIDIQYSQDGVDWYAQSLGYNANIGVASTTPNIGLVTQYTFPFASSTINRSNVTNGNSATSTRSILISTVTRYVRAVFTLPAGSTNGAVWAEFVAQRQAN